MRVLIVGGGIIGLSIARNLIKADVEVILIDKGRVGRKASWVAGGMLAPQAEGIRDKDFLQFCLDSRDMYEDFCRELEKDTGLDTGYWKCGILKLAFSQEELDTLKEDLEFFKSLGLKGQFLTREELKERYPDLGEDVLGGVLYPDDAQVDNRKLVIALEEFVKKNAKVLEYTPVKWIETAEGKFKSVITDSGEIEADICVIAAGAWSDDFGTPVYPVKGEMLALGIDRSNIDRVLYSSRAYLIPRKDYHRLVVGATQENVGFKDGNTVKGTLQLLNGAVSTLKNLYDKDILELWFGYRPATDDELPILGEGNIKNLIYATGHYRNGILLAPITAKIITKYILDGIQDKYLKLYSPLRFKGENR